MVIGLVSQKQQLVATTSKRSSLADPATRPSDSVFFAVIGDFGKEDSDVARVAGMVRGWQPDFITTVGDNIYGYESFETVDRCIGQYYRRFVSPYDGEYGEDSGVNRFYPILGNHDWESIDVDEQGNMSGPYFDFFPEREPYYTFQQGPVRFFMLDSYDEQPAGNTALSTQAMWLRNQLAQSDATWNLVYLHHSPYSSGLKHGSHARLQWPFAQWGAHAVLSGHNHTFERIERDGITYFVNGLGGTSKHGLSKPHLTGSQAGYTNTFGAQLVSASDESVIFQFINYNDELLDNFTLVKDTQPPTEPTGHQSQTVQTIQRRLASAADHGTERLADRAFITTENLLDFDRADNEQYMIGCRFSDVSIPSNAIILDARIGFTASERSTTPASIEIWAEKDCFAANFKSGNQPISRRSKTDNTVSWNEVETWDKIGASYWTPNLAKIVQEVADQLSWSKGNSIAFTFSGQGRRPSVAYDLQPLAAPQLHIEYSLPIMSESNGGNAVDGEALNDGGQKVYLPSIIANQCEVPEE